MANTSCFEPLRQWGETPASPTPGWHLEQAYAQAQAQALAEAEAEAEAIWLRPFGQRIKAEIAFKFP